MRAYLDTYGPATAAFGATVLVLFFLRVARHLERGTETPDKGPKPVTVGTRGSVGGAVVAGGRGDRDRDRVRAALAAGAAAAAHGDQFHHHRAAGPAQDRARGGRRARCGGGAGGRVPAAAGVRGRAPHRDPAGGAGRRQAAQRAVRQGRRAARARQLRRAAGGRVRDGRAGRRLGAAAADVRRGAVRLRTPPWRSSRKRCGARRTPEARRPPASILPSTSAPRPGRTAGGPRRPGTASPAGRRRRGGRS